MQRQALACLCIIKVIIPDSAGKCQTTYSAVNVLTDEFGDLTALKPAMIW
jgi:hypothetical protein